MLNEKIQGPVVIVGAGPCGLGAAQTLQNLGFESWTLYERSECVGGLARSEVDDRGFTWDIGGHVSFSHYDTFTRLLDDVIPGDQWLQHERESWVRLLERWIPYPFQNNVRHLPPKETARCLEGLIKAAMQRPQPPFKHFEDFVEQVFGEGVTELFMRPYNYKVWAWSLNKMDAGWIAERVSVPDPVRVARNVALGEDDVSWGPNNRFRFPLYGGTGAIWRNLAERLPADRLRLGAEVVEVDPERRTVTLADGSHREYGALISTMPLDRLVRIAGMHDLESEAARLMHSATHVIGVGLRGAPSAELAPKCWMYFPEEHSPYYRVTHFSHYSHENVDDINRHWSLMAEVSESAEKKVDADSVVDWTLRALERDGLIENREQVTHTWAHREEYGYPTPGLGRDEALARLLPALEERGILSRGRFGAWKYEVGNMDHSYMQGVEAARHLLIGSPEFTLWRPHVVNQSHPVLGWGLYR